LERSISADSGAPLPPAGASTSCHIPSTGVITHTHKLFIDDLTRIFIDTHTHTHTHTSALQFSRRVSHWSQSKLVSHTHVTRLYQWIVSDCNQQMSFTPKEKSHCYLWVLQKHVSACQWRTDPSSSQSSSIGLIQHPGLTSDLRDRVKIK